MCTHKDCQQGRLYTYVNGIHIKVHHTYVVHIYVVHIESRDCTHRCCTHIDVVDLEADTGVEHKVVDQPEHVSHRNRLDTIVWEI